MQAKIADWLVVPIQQENLAYQKPGIATGNHDATNTSAANMVKTPKIRQLIPGSGAQSSVSGKGHPKIKIRVHPGWTAYSIANAKFMAPQKRQPPIPTENLSSSDKRARQAPKMKRGLKAMRATKSPDHQTHEGKSTPPPYSIGECGKYHQNCQLGPDMHS